MKNGTSRPGAGSDDCFKIGNTYRQSLLKSAETIAAEVTRLDDAFFAITFLQELGPQSKPAVDAIKTMRPVHLLRLSWELLALLAEGQGLNALDLFIELGQEEAMNLFLDAMYDDDWEDCDEPGCGDAVVRLP